MSVSWTWMSWDQLIVKCSAISSLDIAMICCDSLPNLILGLQQHILWAAAVSSDIMVWKAYHCWALWSVQMLRGSMHLPMAHPGHTGAATLATGTGCGLFKGSLGQSNWGQFGDGRVVDLGSSRAHWILSSLLRLDPPLTLFRNAPGKELSTLAGNGA